MLTFPYVFTNDFDNLFKSMKKIHNQLNEGNGILKIEHTDDYKYNKLTNDYVSGPQYEKIDGVKEDMWRVGSSSVNPKEDFMIEDSTGRYIPFEWYNIDSLIKALKEAKEKYDHLVMESKQKEKEYKTNEKIEIQNKINELQEQLKAA